jgi:hypothetical protein
MFWRMQVALTALGLPCQPGRTVQTLWVTAVARFGAALVRSVGLAPFIC